MITFLQCLTSHITFFLPHLKQSLLHKYQTSQYNFTKLQLYRKTCLTENNQKMKKVTSKSSICVCFPIQFHQIFSGCTSD